MKKLLPVAALITLAIPSLPAGAVTVTPPTPVVVKWNTSVAATLTLTTTYTYASPTLSSSASATLFGSPAATCANQSGETDGTVNYGTITPSLSANVNCLYTNAVDATVVTNSTNWNLSETLNTPSPAGLTGYTFCAYPNGYASFPATVSAAAAPTVSSRTAATTDTTTCGSGALSVPIGAAPGTQIASSTTPVTGTGTNVGEDLEMLVAPGATSGADQYNLVYTLVAN